MTDTPGEEAQEERGTPGSRDTGSDGPADGASNRPSGGSDEKSDTSVAPQESGDDAPNLPTP